MPRTNDPLGILTGAGLAPPGSVSPSSIAPGEVSSASSTLDAHVDNPTGAHPASAISILDPYVRYFMGPNVEGALNELAALVPPPMGGVGSEGVAWLGSTNVGTPDWGILKLWDGILPFTGNTAANARAVYPYYYRAPIAASGVGLTGTGIEPATDPTFNVLDGVYTGGGDGTVHAGFVTLAIGAGAVGYPTWRILTAIANPAAVVSGIVSPADRGVLALVKWPTGSEPDPSPAVNVADIQARCVAAILLGKGILDNGCDGEPGGVFSEATAGGRAAATVVYNANPAAGYSFTLDLSSVGGPPAPVTFTSVPLAPANQYQFAVGGGAAATADNLALALNTLYFSEVFAAISNGAGTVDIYLRAAGTVGNAPTTTITCTALPADITITNFAGGTDVVSSPFTFPGRAAGQYNLNEIHTGSSSTGGLDPFYNPAAGQVRLLTDPAAVTFAAPKTVAGGLPIFGATTNAIGTTTPVVGFPFSIGGGTTGNFFAYRLPYLKDYSVATGLIYTPALEKPRFTTKLAPASLGALIQAGDYDDFTADFWAYQIGRYRHRFVLATGAAATRTDDSYALVHFKKEAYFEAYVRDGVVPTNDQLWSVNLVSWTGTVPPYDLIENLATTTPSSSPANPVNRSEVFEDNNGTVIPVPGGLSFTLTEKAAPVTTMFSSGIEYYVPIDVASINDPNVDISALSFSYNGVFDRGYRSHDTVPVAGPLAGDKRAYAVNQNPVFVSLASFSFEGTEAVPPTSTIVTGSPGVTTFPAELGEIRRQRIEFGYADLTPATTVDPAAGDTAAYNFVSPGFGKGINFTGDPNYPVFTTDAKVRVFLRRPLVVDGVTGYPEPIAGTTVPNSTGDTILYHSMQEGAATIKVPYGNPTNAVLRGLTPLKDREELFLDEIYRYPENWTPLGPPDATQLQGPGLPLGPAPISVPVRPNAAIGYDGWYLGGFHTLQLDNATANLNNALQVAGLPPRNPSYSEGLTSPAPSRGVLVYPQTDYSAAHAPAQAAGAASDYSVLTGDRVYIRAFNAGVANAGLSTVKFRLWGVELTDFQYTPLTGPGATGMAVLVKVPGLTTWMDAGRADGTGPSKQDIALDGAGCLLASTVATDTVSQIRYSDITLNLAPAALFINGEGNCPVLVKVILKDNFTGKALNFANVAETAATSLCRGLVGIEVL